MAASSIVADTHAIVWYLSNDKKISRPAFNAIDETLVAAVPVYVSAISIVELIYLVEHRKVPREALDVLLSVLKDPATSLAVAPMDLPIAEALAEIPRDEIPDMPDRIIAATARALGLPLVSADTAIRESSSVASIW